MLDDWPSIGTEFAACVQVLFRAQRNVLQETRTFYADMEMIKTAFQSRDLEIAQKAYLIDISLFQSLIQEYISNTKRKAQSKFLFTLQELVIKRKRILLFSVFLDFIFVNMKNFNYEKLKIYICTYAYIYISLKFC